MPSCLCMYNNFYNYFFEALCRAGTFSPTGLEPCMKCEKGFYQEEDGQTVCKRCIEGRTTSSEGSNSSAECGGKYHSKLQKVVKVTRN